MKNLFVVSALLLNAFNFAQADDQAGPAALQIRGPQALAIMETLVTAGATEKVIPDLATLSVQNLSVSAGFSPHTGSFASLSATQEIPGPAGTHFVRLVNVNASGDEARAVFSALEAAGIKGQSMVEFTVIRVTNLNCRSGMIPAAASCDIQLAR